MKFLSALFVGLQRFPPTGWLLKKTRLGDAVGMTRNYTKWFGYSTGLPILFRTMRSDQAPVAVTPPGLAHPVWIRPATTDPLVYREVFVDESYAVGLPHEARFVIDAGANIGLTSVFLAHRFPGATIVSIEPASRNFSVLQRNTQPYPNVALLQAGLWPVSGPLKLVERPGEDWAHQVQPCSPEEADFQAVTVPEVLAKFGQARVNFLKIDIEGAEWPLFFDAPPDWLRQVDVLNIELHPLGDTALLERTIKLIATYGLQADPAGLYNYTFRRSAL